MGRARGGTARCGGGRPVKITLGCDSTGSNRYDPTLCICTATLSPISPTLQYRITRPSPGAAWMLGAALACIRVRRQSSLRTCAHVRFHAGLLDRISERAKSCPCAVQRSSHQSCAPTLLLRGHSPPFCSGDCASRRHSSPTSSKWSSTCSPRARTVCRHARTAPQPASRGPTAQWIGSFSQRCLSCVSPHLKTVCVVERDDERWTPGVQVWHCFISEETATRN